MISLRWLMCRLGAAALVVLPLSPACFAQEYAIAAGDEASPPTATQQPAQAVLSETNSEPPLRIDTEIGAGPVSQPGNAEPITTLDLTHSTDDIWARIRKGFGMTDLVSPVVDDRVSYYAARPQALRTMLERGRKYLYHIVTELEKRGMPTELALLPIVESAFNPQAMSSAKAAGLWQFIPSTGKDFQLTQNWWVDERRDVVASTNAALQYLQAIYEMHGDWHLALASYNWGEGAVARAINNNNRAGKPIDFNSLNMPAETRQYVPKLQALKQIIASPELYAVQLPRVPNRPYFRTVERRNGIDVAVAAKLAEMPQADFLALNPAYNRPVIPGSKDAAILLPIENANRFEVNLSRYNEPLVNWKTYSVPRAGRVDQIAQRLRLNIETLCSVNGIAPRARLAAGYTLLIPQTADTALQEIVRNGPDRSLSSGVRQSRSTQLVQTRATRAQKTKSRPQNLTHRVSNRPRG